MYIYIYIYIYIYSLNRVVDSDLIVISLKIFFKICFGQK